MKGPASLLAACMLWALPAAAAEPIATTEGEQPGRKIEVMELKRSGDVLMLKFRMINEGEEKLDFSYDYAEPGLSSDHGSIGGVHIVDEKGKKKYLVLRDEKKACLCSRSVKAIEPKRAATLWARFPAPPEAVEKVSVVIPHFLPLDDVPISK